MINNLCILVDGCESFPGFVHRLWQHARYQQPGEIIPRRKTSNRRKIRKGMVAWQQQQNRSMRIATIG